MICSVMQPTFLPWIGYFDLIDHSDTFVLYDDVQYVKGTWGNRNRVLTSNGESYLTVPVKKYPFGSLINEIEIDLRKPWGKKQLKTIFYSYKKAPFFEEVYKFFEDILNKEFVKLSALNIYVIQAIAEKIGINNVNFYLSSELKSTEGVKDVRLVAICQELNCNHYHSPFGSYIYIEENIPGGEFSKNNMTLSYQNYIHPVYSQIHGEFTSHMSIVDLLFNVGFNQALEVIRSGRKPHFSSETLMNKVNAQEQN